MIVFKKLTYKNFLSTGNAANTILLNKAHSTLVVGKNGEGKSTMLDALCFALFGKPFRNVTKPQLINSINGKQLCVEVEFDIGTKQYKVIRGMKPNIFEIWCDNLMLNQDAASRDYQKALEQQILRLNYKTFTQVVILGSASFVPFMQLPTGQRREVIEDILDIRIFSMMNHILKDRIQETKEKIVSIDSAISTAKERVSAQKKIIQTITAAKDSSIEKLQAKIREVSTEIFKAQDQQSSIQVEIEDLIKSTLEEDTVRSDLKKANSARVRLDAAYEDLGNKIEFLQNSEECPSCAQKIPHEHKTITILESQKKIGVVDGEKQILDKCLDKLTKKIEEISKINSTLTKKNIELSTINNSIVMYNRQISSLTSEIEENKKDTANVDIEKYKLKELAEDAMSKLTARDELVESKNLQEIASLLLKDTGIKTAIIREYLPVMNKLINKYLNIMDSYIHFELDESFNEIIKSRFRDEFTYASFSEGEKQRIDLAILFTWRQIAKMKNSVNTNLLIFDEIMDSSLDVNGTESFMSLLGQFGEDTNIFVISHKGDILFDKFHSVIRIEKKNDFSTIV